MLSNKKLKLEREDLLQVGETTVDVASWAEGPISSSVRLHDSLRPNICVLTKKVSQMIGQNIKHDQ